MQFSLAALATMVAVVSAGILPSKFILAADGTDTVRTVNGVATINGGSPVLQLSYDNGQLTYLADGATPTSWQNLYVIENDVKPIGLTTPHSGAVPEGGKISGFGMSADGYLTYNDKQFWGKDTTTGEIYYVGLGKSNKVGVKLQVQSAP